MGSEKWKAFLEKFPAGEKRSRLLIFLGLLGVVLIYCSSLWSSSPKQEQSLPGDVREPTAEERAKELEQELVRMVCAITGEENPAVLVTLESGTRWVYAADEAADAREEGGESSRKTETSHVILKDSDGAQRALTVMEIQPEVKGVVIVSKYAEDPVIREKLTEAVRVALHISSARVCVTDSG